MDHLKDKHTKKILQTFIGLAIAGAALNFVPISLHYRIDLVLGGLFAIIGLYMLPPAAALAAGALIAAPTIYLWNHPYGVAVYSAEIVCMYLLLKKTRLPLLACSGLTWFFILPPFLYLLMVSGQRFFPVAAHVLILKYMINGMVNGALAATVISIFQLPRPGKTSPIVFKASEKAVNFSVIITVIPLMIFMMFDSRLLFESVYAKVQSKHEIMQKSIANSVRQWRERHQFAVKSIAKKASEYENLADPRLQETLEDFFKGFRGFYCIYVADADGTTTSFYPTSDFDGNPTIGLNFAEREYFQRAKATMKSVATGIFPSRSKERHPLIGLAEPVIRNGKFSGIIFGALEPLSLRDQLRGLYEEGVAVTVLDDRDLVVFSNKSLKLADKFDFSFFNRSEVTHGRLRLLKPEGQHSAAMKYWLSVMFLETRLLEPANWRLIIEEPMGRYVEELFKVTKSQFTNVLMMILGILLLSTFVSRFFSRPLEKLSQLTSTIADTGFSEIEIAAPESNIQEIITLHANFSAAITKINQARQSEKEQNLLLSETNQVLHDKIEQLNRARNQMEIIQKNLSIVLSSAPFCIILADRNGTIEYVNDEFSRQCCLDGTSRSTLKEVFSNFLPYGEMRFPVESFLKSLAELDGAGKIIESGELCIVSKREPTIFHCIATLIENRCIVIMSDVTGIALAHEEKRRLEEHMQMTQRLESLGILAGGVAHDFNNILQSILGYAELTIAGLPVGSQLRENVKLIESAATRAADLTGQMLAYTGQGKMASKPFELTELVKEMTAILTVSISKLVTVRFNFQESLLWATGDPAQIRQVVMNLVLNAAEAIGDNHGQITISTGLVLSDDYHLQTALFFRGDKDCKAYTYFEVIDTGCGIDEKHLNRIFDPFFTTKFTGRGLGLAATMGIIKAHHGAIFVSSMPDRGSCFRIMIPTARNELLDIKSGESIVEEDAALDLSGKVLVVDDEETVLSIIALMLEPSGAGLLTASNGQEALEIFARDHAGIALVILDLVMPKMKGEVVFREMKKIDPAVPIIIASGYSMEETVTRLESVRFDGFLQKPFRRSALIKEIIKSTRKELVSGS